MGKQFITLPKKKIPSVQDDGLITININYIVSYEEWEKMGTKVTLIGGAEFVDVTPEDIDYEIGIDRPIPKKETPAPGKRYVHGLKGIQELFNVSHLTAQRYKDGILKDAVYQYGRKIVVDADKAIELFDTWYGRKKK